MSNRDAPHSLTVNHDREARRILLEPPEQSRLRALIQRCDCC